MNLLVLVYHRLPYTNQTSPPERHLHTLQEQDVNILTVYLSYCTMALLSMHTQHYTFQQRSEVAPHRSASTLPYFDSVKNYFGKSHSEVLNSKLHLLSLKTNKEIVKDIFMSQSHFEVKVQLRVRRFLFYSVFKHCFKIYL